MRNSIAHIAMNISRKTLRIAKLTLSLLACIAVAGCTSYKVAVTVDVPNSGEHIVTKNRYRLEGFIDSRSRGAVTSEGEVRRMTVAANKRRYLFERYQPEVFSETGIPIVIAGESTSLNWQDYSHGKSVSGGYLLCYLVTCGILPCITSYEDDIYGRLETVDGVRMNADVYMRIDRDDALTCPWSPFGLCYLIGNEGSGEYDGNRLFVKRGVSNGSINDLTEPINDLMVEALAYGIAVRLKELESRGLIVVQERGARR